MQVLKRFSSAATVASPTFRTMRGRRCGLLPACDGNLNKLGTRPAPPHPNPPSSACPASKRWEQAALRWKPEQADHATPCTGRLGRGCQPSLASEQDRPPPKSSLPGPAATSERICTAGPGSRLYTSGPGPPASASTPAGQAAQVSDLQWRAAGSAAASEQTFGGQRGRCLTCGCQALPRRPWAAPRTFLAVMVRILTILRLETGCFQPKEPRRHRRCDGRPTTARCACVRVRARGGWVGVAVSGRKHRGLLRQRSWRKTPRRFHRGQVLLLLPDH